LLLKKMVPSVVGAAMLTVMPPDTVLKLPKLASKPTPPGTTGYPVRCVAEITRGSLPHSIQKPGTRATGIAPPVVL
jgi:hypothetical protein